jgi:hypothetical protein
VSADPQAAELEELLLEWLTMAHQETVSRELLSRAKVRVIADVLGRDLTAQLYAYLLADKVLTEAREVPFRAMVEVPERWRDRLGLVFGKRRMLATGTVTIKADYYQTFPESTIPYPDHLGAPVRMVKLTQDYEADDADDE